VARYHLREMSKTSTNPPDRCVCGLQQAAGGARPRRRRGATALAAGATVVAAALAHTPPVKPSEIELLSTVNALIMAGTDMHVVDQSWVDMAIDGYIRPSLGGDYTGIPVVTPAQFWPFGGPDDMLFDLSVLAGTRGIDAAIDATTDSTVVFGYSQSAVIATAAKRRLAERSADAANAESKPPVSFVMLANLNRPNGGLNARFPGAFIEELGWTFSAATPTDTGFTTVDVARQYDLFADFPRYPLNLIADANAVVALFYGAHDYSSVTLNPADPRYDPNTVVEQFGDTTYYFIPTPLLPLLRPLRDLGFDPVQLDAVEPAMRVLVEFGYDRSSPFGQPTGAQLIPRENFDQLGRDLAVAINQGRAILESAAADSAQETGVRPAQRRAAGPALRRGNLPGEASSLTGPAPTAQSTRAGSAATRKTEALKPRATEARANRPLR